MAALLMQAALTISKRALPLLSALAECSGAEAELFGLPDALKEMPALHFEEGVGVHVWVASQANTSIPLPQSGLVQAGLQATPCILPCFCCVGYFGAQLELTACSWQVCVLSREFWKVAF